MDAKMKLSIIVAMDKNGIIGNGNVLPWERIPEDLKNFRRLTLDHTVVMGRKTFESIGHPLDKRKNIVISRDKDFHPEGCMVARSLDEALQYAQSESEVFVIGGRQVYELALPIADRLYITEIYAIYAGNVSFPEYNKKEWQRIAATYYYGSPELAFETYERLRVVNLSHARSPEQHSTMEDILERGKCPFCLDQLHLYHKKPILREGEHWVVTENQWPYEDTRIQLLFITKVHAERLVDLPPEAGKELFEFLQWAEFNYQVKSGAYFMRFGDTRYNGATVNHLHIHFVVPDFEKPGFEKLHVKIGSKPKAK